MYDFILASYGELLKPCALISAEKKFDKKTWKTNLTVEVCIQSLPQHLLVGPNLQLLDFSFCQGQKLPNSYEPTWFLSGSKQATIIFLVFVLHINVL